MTLLLGFAAVNTGNNLLYLLVSALLGFMAISGILGKWNLSRIEVHCIPAQEVYDDTPALLGVQLVNHRRWLPIFLMELLIEDTERLCPFVDAAQRRRVNITYTFQGRGRQTLPAVTLRSRFPINFFIRYKTLSTEGSLIVLPQPRPCPMPHQPGPEGRRGQQAAWTRGQDGDISRITDYQGGEPLKLIHWKLSARHDALKVKELEAATQTPVILDLDLVPGKNLEQRLGAATYLVIQTLRAGRPVGLQLGSLVFPAATGRSHRKLLLEALATYGQN